MKRKYFSPSIRQLWIGSDLMQAASKIPVSSSKQAEAENGGWSKEFWGLAEDDSDADSEFNWE